MGPHGAYAVLKSSWFVESPPPHDEVLCIHVHVYAGWGLCMHVGFLARMNTGPVRCPHTLHSSVLGRVYVHTYIHTCVHAYIHTYMHAYIQHAYVHSACCVNTYVHEHIHRASVVYQCSAYIQPNAWNSQDKLSIDASTLR